MNDPYRILGVSPQSSEEEITRAYRAQARRCHPDLHPGDAAAEARMKEINAAYEAVKAQRAGGNAYGSASGGASQSTYGGDPYGSAHSGAYGSAYGSTYGGAYRTPYGTYYVYRTPRSHRRRSPMGIFFRLALRFAVGILILRMLLGFAMTLWGGLLYGYDFGDDKTDRAPTTQESVSDEAPDREPDGILDRYRDAL
jgi:hypothetical protein